METIESIKLVQAVKEGNAKAFNHLVDNWYQKIYNYALKFIGDHERAMEITQKTFIAVHQHIGQLKDAKLFKSWLYQIAINYCREEGRKQKRKWIFPFVSFKQQDSQFAEVQDFIKTPQANLEQEELNELLLKALALLPEDQRAVVIMKEYEGLKFREIAQVLNVSENTAKSRMYYGLKHLKKTFDEWNINKENTYYEY